MKNESGQEFAISYDKYALAIAVLLKHKWMGN